MNLKNLLNDDSAVSPVIGVILMVAITVILAAVIGTFVLGLGDQVSESTPQVSWDFENPSGGFVATHAGGDAVAFSNVELTGGSVGAVTDSDGDSDGKMEAGDSMSGANQASGTVRVTWSSPSSSDTAVIGKYEP